MIEVGVRNTVGVQESNKCQAIICENLNVSVQYISKTSHFKKTIIKKINILHKLYGDGTVIVLPDWKWIKPM